MKLRTLIMMILATGVMTLVGCGGGGGGGGTPAPSTDTVISGVASAGPINGGTVQAFAIDANGVVGTTVIGTATSNADGTYTVNVGSYTGAVLIKVTGGTYRDEATQNTKNLATEASGGMRAVIASVTTGTTTVSVTPLTELAVQKAGTLTAANITKANTDVSNFFKLPNIVSTVPVDASSTPAATVTTEQKAYGLAVAAVSQLQNTKGTTLGALLASVGGEMVAAGGISATTLNDINAATKSFLDSANNKTGLTSATVPAIIPSGGVLKLNTSGTLGTNLIGGIDIIVTLPTGVTIKTLASANGQAADGVVTVSGIAGSASGTTISIARFDAATGTVRIGIGNTAGFGVGEFVTINCDVASTVTTFPTATSFAVPTQTAQIFDSQSAPLAGITAAAGSFTVSVQ